MPQAIKSQRKLPVDAKHARRDQRDEDAAQGSAQRHHQVEQRQMARRGTAASQFAVAEHAADEQPGRESGYRILDVEIAVLRINHVRHARQMPEPAAE